MRIIAASLAALVYSGISIAAQPDSGWYWNPDESGRGFNIEIQNNVLFMAGFVYDASGNPTWFASGGPMNSDHSYTGPAFQTIGGQPLGGPYRVPTIVPFGTASITFNTTTQATIAVNGYTFNVVRQEFGVDFTSVYEPLLGEWSITQGAPGIWFAQRILFTGTLLSNGATFAAGHMTGDTTRVAVGQFNAGTWGVLLDSSPSYYTLYAFSYDGVNLVEGQSSVYLKGTSPTGSLPAVGFKTKSAQAAAGLDAPGTIYEIGPPKPGAMATTRGDAELAAAIAKQAPGPLLLPLSQIRALERALAPL
ncbi:MAG: hypothetical protein ACREYD_08840 [Casimicrobiaceae bacterium]